MSDQERLPDPILGDRFVEAAGYAVELHARQARRGRGSRTSCIASPYAAWRSRTAPTRTRRSPALLHDGAGRSGRAGHAG